MRPLTHLVLLTVLTAGLVQPVRAQAAPFPSAGVLDRFNRADGSLGAGWSGGVGAYGLRGNRVDVEGSDAVFWNAAAFGPDQEVFITLTAVDPAAAEIDLLLKSQSPGGWGEGVLEVWYDPGKQQVKVVTYTASQGWVDRGTPLPAVFADGDVFGARATAAGRVEVYRNGALLGARDVTGWPYAAAGGYIGMWMINAPNAQLDDFGGGTLSTPTPTRTAARTNVNTATRTARPAATVTPRAPAATRTPTRTATRIATRTATRTAPRTATRTATRPAGPTATPRTGAAAAPLAFPLGPGGADVIPHQIVRTKTDRVYTFVSQNGSSLIRSYYTPKAGLPASAAAFTAGPQVAETAGAPLSVEAVYADGDVIHVFVNTTSGLIRHYPFDLNRNTFGTPTTLASDGAPMNAGDAYVGTSGLSAALDLSGRLHLVYWRSGNRLVHLAYQATGAALSRLSGPTLVDTAGAANHPAVAVSPADNTLTVAWIAEAGGTAQVLARTRTAAGRWGAVETVSAAPPWHSAYFGLNIDQGPSLLITPDGVRHLAYIEDYNGASDYGRIHIVEDAGTGWTDTALANYSHDPALAYNAATHEVYLLGHGHPLNGQSAPACLSMDALCFMKQTGGRWGPMQLVIAQAGWSFDGSPSVKAAAAGLYRPDVVEAVFFAIQNGNYNAPTLYYARLP